MILGINYLVQISLHITRQIKMCSSVKGIRFKALDTWSKAL